MKSKDFEIRTPFLGVGDPLANCLSDEEVKIEIYFYMTINCI